MGLDGVRRPVQPLGDGLAVQPADHEPQHLPLSVGELDEQLRGRLGDRAVRGREDHGEQAGRKPRPAQHRGADRGDDVLGGLVLGHEAHGAGLDGPERGGGVGIGGQHDDPRRRRQGGQLRREVDAADVAELHVHDHGVRPVRRHHTEDLARVGDGRHGLEVGLRAEDALQPLGKDPVVIDDEQLDRGRHVPAAGCSGCQPLTSTSPSRTA
jgi:hypothetical protein